MKEIIIIGGGPAGVSAALYTVRAGHITRILQRDDGALMQADTVENYYGIEAPLSGRELHERAKKNARRLIGNVARVTRKSTVSVHYHIKILSLTLIVENHSNIIKKRNGVHHSANIVKAIISFRGDVKIEIYLGIGLFFYNSHLISKGPLGSKY